MKTVPGRQDGIAALRQRLFFAGELLKLGERALAGPALNRQGLAMACRNGAVLQLHAVLTGLLDDVALRLRLDRSPESLTVERALAALADRGMASPELGRLAGLLEGGGWLVDCEEEIRRCLSSQPDGQREQPGYGEGDHDHDHGQHPARIRMVAVLPREEIEPLSAEDFSRIRHWIAGWRGLLDEFLVTLDEY